MSRPRQDHCKRGHPLSEAHVVRTAKGLKRTCRKCRYLRHCAYHGIKSPLLQEHPQ